MVDTELIIRCQLGDEKSYDELYEAIGKKALWTAYLHAGRMDIAETNQTYQVLKEAVNKLSPPMRTTIILHYYNNMTIEEIAKVMKCNWKT